MFCFVFLAPYARTTRYEEVFLPKGKNGLGRFAASALPHYEEAFFPIGKKRPRSLCSLGLALL